MLVQYCADPAGSSHAVGYETTYGAGCMLKQIAFARPSWSEVDILSERDACLNQGVEDNGIFNICFS